MSEYQYIEFQAVDRPLTDAELAYARKQSTRAEISRWSFQNHYYFGDFHGDVKGLLRRGYDVHLHYANFGIRTVALRLSAGLPFAKKVWSQYVGKRQLSWTPDQRGEGGILILDPYHEAGELDAVWEFEHHIGAMVDLRCRLIAGDLRVLYLLWLAAVFDGQQDLQSVIEPPVPGGLAKMAGSSQPFLEFFGLDPLLLAAAAEASTEAPGETPPEQLTQQWVESQSETDAKSLLQEFLSKDSAAVKSATLSRILAATESSIWPTVTADRTCQVLLDRAAELRKAQSE